MVNPTHGKTLGVVLFWHEDRGMILNCDCEEFHVRKIDTQNHASLVVGEEVEFHIRWGDYAYDVSGPQNSHLQLDSLCEQSLR